MSLKILRHYIKKYITSESTAWKRHGVEFDPLSDLKKWVDKGAYVFFGDVNKLGVNPSFAYTKPFGIWSYSLDGTTFDEITSKNIRFAGDRRYIQVFRPKIRGSILMIDDVDEEQYNELVSEISRTTDVDPSTIKVKGSSPGERLLYFTKKLAGNPVKQSMLFKRLGFDGIHYGSRNIAVFFGKDTVEHLDTVLNPGRKDR